MARERSPSPILGGPLTLLIVLVVVLFASWWLLHSASRVEQFAVPTFRGRTVFDRLYGVLFGTFSIFWAIGVLKPDVARYWAERALAQDEFWARITKNRAPRPSVEDRLPTWRGWAKVFALVAFVIGGCSLVREAVTLFVG